MGKKNAEIIYRNPLIGSLGEVNFRRIILGLYLALFLGVAGTSAYYFFQTQREYDRLKNLHQESLTELAVAKEKLREQERILERLRTDPAYVEKVIRRRLFYAKKNEYIFRFED